MRAILPITPSCGCDLESEREREREQLSHTVHTGTDTDDRDHRSYDQASHIDDSLAALC